MKNEPLFKLLGVAMAAAVILAFATAASAAARAGADSDTGGAAVADAGRTRSGVRDTARGKVAWEVTRSWDPATRTTTLTGSRTLPDGRKMTWQSTRVAKARGHSEETGFVVSADGKRSSFTAVRTRVGPGAWQIQRTITGADGKVTLKTISVRRIGDTVTRVATIVRPDGTTETRTQERPRRGHAAPAIPDI